MILKMIWPLDTAESLFAGFHVLKKDTSGLYYSLQALVMSVLVQNIIYLIPTSIYYAIWLNRFSSPV